MPGVESLQELADRVAAALAAHEVADKAALHRLKQRLARELGVAVPTDADLRALLPEGADPLLRTKPMRSQSGVAIVAVMTSPAACPHGKCVYCPGGPDVGVPQSYTGHEPSTMRAMRLDYDPYRVVRTRLGRLEANGHPVDKVELIVQGGTFPARDEAYQDWAIAMMYAGCNEGPCLEDPGGLEDLAAWEAMDAGARLARLHGFQKANEEARCRAVGLTVETKPDWCLEPHVDRMLAHGVTRVELGLQTLDEDVLRLTHRGHTLQDSRDAMRVARDAGLKVCVHMMPGQPRRARAAVAGTAAGPGRAPALSTAEDAISGVPRVLPMAGTTGSADRLENAGRVEPAGRLDPDPVADLEDLRRLFEEEDWRPDMLKIYPTLVVQEGETSLKKWWREGRYTPYGTAEARDLVAAALAHVPEYCRIQRVDRDIPTTHVEAGVMNSNLRQLAEQTAASHGTVVRDLRAREAGVRLREGRAVDPERLGLVERTYRASGGLEVLLSLEDPVADAVAGFCRLRRVGPCAHRPEAAGHVAIVRELKVFGAALPLGGRDGEAFQHRGLGARLLTAAEAQAFQGWRSERLLVIAGVGVKGYYRRHGYVDLGPYVAKLGLEGATEGTP